MWKYETVYEMYHTGVLGMKWGKRKTVVKKPVSNGKRKVMTTNKQTATPYPKKEKKIKDLSDTALTNKINRYKKEKELKILEAERRSNSEKMMKAMLSQVLAPAMISAGKAVTTELFTKIGKEELGLTSKDPLTDLRREVDYLRLIDEKKKLKNIG